MVASLLAMVGTLWLAVFLMVPRRPALMRNEVAWLVYTRHYSNWHRLFTAAVIVSLAALLIVLIAGLHGGNSDLFRLRNACVGTAVAVGQRDDACWSLDTQNVWHIRYIFN